MQFSILDTVLSIDIHVESIRVAIIKHPLLVARHWTERQQPSLPKLPSNFCIFRDNVILKALCLCQIQWLYFLLSSANADSAHHISVLTPAAPTPEGGST